MKLKRNFKKSIYKNRAFDIRITSQKPGTAVWRDFILPERITFKDLEDLILISFDTKSVSFKKDDVIADYFFKKDIPIYSSDNKFKIEFNGKTHEQNVQDAKDSRDKGGQWSGASDEQIEEAISKIERDGGMV